MIKQTCNCKVTKMMIEKGIIWTTGAPDTSGEKGRENKELIFMGDWDNIGLKGSITLRNCPVPGCNGKLYVKY